MIERGIGDPPVDTRRRELRSYEKSAELLMASVSIVLAMFDTLTRSRSTSLKNCSAEKVRHTTCVALISVIEYTANASTKWKRGAKWPHTSIDDSRISKAIPQAWAETVAIESATHFGLPVVPDV